MVAARTLDLLRELRLAGLPLNGYGCGGSTAVVDGIVTMELARADAEAAIVNATHTLGMRAIHMYGSVEQKVRFLPLMAAYGLWGSLTAPPGSHALTATTQSGSPLTAEKVGDTWLLNGSACLVGNRKSCGVTVVWVSDPAVQTLRGYVVHDDLDGVSTESARAGASDEIAATWVRFANVEVLERNRLPGARRTADVQPLLSGIRMSIAWIATGFAATAYAAARSLQENRLERPGVHQDLDDVAANLSASAALCVLAATMIDAGGSMTERRAKMLQFNSIRHMRNAVARVDRYLGSPAATSIGGATKLIENYSSTIR